MAHRCLPAGHSVCAWHEQGCPWVTACLFLQPPYRRWGKLRHGGQVRAGQCYGASPVSPASPSTGNSSICRARRKTQPVSPLDLSCSQQPPRHLGSPCLLPSLSWRRGGYSKQLMQLGTSSSLLLTSCLNNAQNPTQTQTTSSY